MSKKRKKVAKKPARQKKIARAKQKDSIYDHPHVYVATPAYDGKVDTDYSQSLSETAFTCAIMGVYFTAAVMGNGAFIDLARNFFVKIFLEDNPEATHLFFVDSDLKFERRALPELVRHCTAERPVVCGAYRRRNDIEDYPIRWEPHPELSKDGVDKIWKDDKGWLMTNRVPTGFLCIRRNIIEEMAEKSFKLNFKKEGMVPRLFYTKLDKDGRFIGEDFAWCDDYLEQYPGKWISCWPDFNFVHGGYPCNYEKWMSKNQILFDDGGKAIRKTIGGSRKEDGSRKPQKELLDTHDGASLEKSNAT